MSVAKEYPITLSMKAMAIRLVERQMKKRGWTTKGLASKAMVSHTTVKNFLDPDRNCLLSTYECITWACDIVTTSVTVDTNGEIETRTKLRVVR